MSGNAPNNRGRNLNGNRNRNRGRVHPNNNSVGGNGGFNNVNTPSGGPVQFTDSMSAREPESYGIPAMSSDAQDHRGHGSSTSVQSGASSAANASSTAAIEAILAAGPITVSITAERELPSANVNSPSFLHGFVLSITNQGEWANVVLPHIRSFTFNIPCTTDLHYFANILASRQLPNLHQAITKLEFPAFYWFSGVVHNRRANPYFEMTRSLPALEELSFRLHTAGITVSCFGERQVIALGATDPERAKELKVMQVEDVVRKYELGAIFACRGLRRVRVEYLECEMTRYFTRVGDPVALLREVQMYIANGLVQYGLNTFVELVRVG